MLHRIHYPMPSKEIRKGVIGSQKSKKISNMKTINVPNELNRMLIENQQLRQKNILLRKKVSLFTQLIKDPKMVKSVLNILKIQTPPLNRML